MQHAYNLGFFDRGSFIFAWITIILGLALAEEVMIYDKDWRVKEYLQVETIYERDWRAKGRIENGRVYDRNWNRINRPKWNENITGIGTRKGKLGEVERGIRPMTTRRVEKLFSKINCF